jgi:ubiquinone/menaquinone biosynthesis C-methylase UbiE
MPQTRTSTDASFDVILCQQGLQFFPDKLAALREMHRVSCRLGACSSASSDQRGHTTLPWVKPVNGMRARRPRVNIALHGYSQVPTPCAACSPKHGSAKRTSVRA